MKKIIWMGILQALLMSLCACGDETTNVVEYTGMSVIEMGTSMPDCSAGYNGRMVYVMDSSAAFVCANGNWESLKGEKGDKGENGKTGEPGKNGEDGANGYACTMKKLRTIDGYKIVCGGDSIGVLMNGANGEDGIDGRDGRDGLNGSSCNVVVLDSSDEYKIVCGDDSVGVLRSGMNGLSAYEVAKANGFTGSEEEWLDSLKGALGDRGAKGDSGRAGKSAYQLAVEAGFEGNIDEWLESLKGADGKSFGGGWMIDPRDKHIYRTVIIDNETWMAENLNYAYTAKTATLDSSSFCYNDSLENCEKYGRLYLFSAVMDSAGVIPGNKANNCGYGGCQMRGTVRGVCPEGWHVPTCSDWDKVAYRPEAGRLFKSSTGWADRDDGTSGNGMDVYGFSVLPAGYLTYSFLREFAFIAKDSSAVFWSMTALDEEEVCIASAYYGHDKMAAYRSDIENYAVSVRCIKD